MPYGFWALNLGPLEEQPVLLTIKPSLQLHLLLLKQNVEAFRRRISIIGLMAEDFNDVLRRLIRQVLLHQADDEHTTKDKYQRDLEADQMNRT